MRDFDSVGHYILLGKFCAAWQTIQWRAKARHARKDNEALPLAAKHARRGEARVLKRSPATEGTWNMEEPESLDVAPSYKNKRLRSDTVPPERDRASYWRTHVASTASRNYPNEQPTHHM